MTAPRFDRPVTLRSVVLAVPVLVACLAFEGNATQATVASVPVTLQSAVPLDQVTDIGAQPLALLAKFPQAGPSMAGFVAKVLAAQPSVVDAILSIVNDTSPQQASAIGAGLVRGLRAVSGKHEGLARSITEKVMRSDNLWLKSTFLAIGPQGYRAGPLVMSENVPPAVPRDLIGGEELPLYKGRVGPDEEKGIFWVDEKTKNTSEYYDFDPKNRHGMIVALLASDAPSNGAVSTSPTN